MLDLIFVKAPGRFMVCDRWYLQRCDRRHCHRLPNTCFNLSQTENESLSDWPFKNMFLCTSLHHIIIYIHITQSHTHINAITHTHIYIYTPCIHTYIHTYICDFSTLVHTDVLDVRCLQLQCSCPMASRSSPWEGAEAEPLDGTWLSGEIALRHLNRVHLVLDGVHYL